MRKSIIRLTIFMSLFIGAWLVTRYAYLFFAALGVVLLGAMGMFIYLLIKRQPAVERREGIFAAIGWLLLAWLVIRANGLTVMSLWV